MPTARMSCREQEIPYTTSSNSRSWRAAREYIINALLAWFVHLVQLPEAWLSVEHVHCNHLAQRDAADILTHLRDCIASSKKALVLLRNDQSSLFQLFYKHFKGRHFEKVFNSSMEASTPTSHDDSHASIYARSPGIMMRHKSLYLQQ